MRPWPRQRARRRARNPRYSLRAFAQHLGVDHATLSQWLRGRRPVSPRRAARLMASLGVEMAADRTSSLGPSHRAIRDLVRAPGFVADSRWIANGDHVLSCPVVQWQIVTRDPDTASSFYCGFFRWTVNSDNPVGYRVVATGSPEGIGGGVWPSPPEGHNFVQLFVRVPSVPDYVARAEHAGARVLIPPQRLPEGGVLAIRHDPQGIPFGLVGE